MLPNDSPSSYPQAMSILQSAIPDINRLVCLTEIIGRNQWLRDPEREYESWNEWTRDRNTTEEETRLRVQRGLRRQLREFALEGNPVIEVDAELERWHDSMINKPENNVDLAAREEGASSASEFETSEYESDNESTRVFSSFQSERANRNEGSDTARELDINDSQSLRGLARASSKDGSTRGEYKEGGRKRSPEFSPESLSDRYQKKRGGNANEIATVSGGFASEEGEKKPPNIAHELLPNQPHREVDQQGTKTSDLGANWSLSNTKEPPKKRPYKKKSAHWSVVDETRKGGGGIKDDDRAHSTKQGPPKKCHDCKNSSTNYRHCHYWTVTGKCKKKYCIDCLSSKYPLTMVDTISDLEWHCPSCLGTCLCQVCTVQRQKEEEWERNRNEAERKSSRRSAAGGGNSYSLFF
jgi:hypothetical protein